MTKAFILYSVQLLVLLNAFLFFFIILQNSLRNSLKALQKKHERRFEKIIKQKLITDTPLSPEQFAPFFLQKKLLARTAIAYLDNFKGPVRDSLPKFLKDIGYTRYVEKTLGSRSIKKQLWALQELAKTNTPKRQLIIAKLDSSSPLVRHEAIRSLCSLRYKPALPAIFKKLPRTVDYTLAAALMSFDKDLDLFLRKHKPPKTPLLKIIYQERKKLIGAFYG
jgi:hypothetical protein